MMLTAIYDKLICKDQFEDGVYELDGLWELIKHHPGLKEEIWAIKNIVEGEKVLNSCECERGSSKSPLKHETRKNTSKISGGNRGGVALVKSGLPWRDSTAVPALF